MIEIVPENAAIHRQSDLPEELLEAIRGAERILVQGHVRPDGDTLGSSLGLGLALEKLGKHVHLCLVDGVPERFAYLPEVERFSTDPREGGPYDLAITCDAASYSRVGAPLLEEGLVPFLVNMDHHPTNEGYGHLAWIDAESSSTCEMAYRVIEGLGIELDQRIGAALMNGIATDTGFFKYPCATPRTLRIFARLMETGVDHAEMHRTLFEDTPLGEQRIRGRALERITSEDGGQILWTWLSLRDGEECGVAGPLASLGVHPLTPVHGAELVACFEERGPEATVVEFRSRGEIPVDELARSLGGGGHAKASGCTVPLGLEAAQAEVLPRLRSVLAAAQAKPRAARG